jgi:hypothetical protein
MTVHLAGRGPVFWIETPNGNPIADNYQLRDWEGTLPVSGTYHILVKGEY